MECLAEMPHAPLDRRPRKHQRLGWDVGPEIAQIKFCGQDVANVITAVTLGLSTGGIVSSEEAQEVFRFATPPIREDDKDGHYVFAVGDNLTSRYRINAKMGEGTFGQVLECWDRERKEMVAIKIIRGIKKYRDAAMIEIGMLEQLCKYEKSRSRAFARMELRCPKALDPNPSWTLGDVFTELDALQATRRAAQPTPLKQPPEWASTRREKAFVMRVEEEDDSEEEDDNSDEDARALVTTGARFSCNDLELSFEESEDELDSSCPPYHLMEKTSLEKSILVELEREHHLKIQEEVRSKLTSLDVCHQNEIQRTISAFARLPQYAESRKDLDRRLDVQFQRKIAEVLDKHLCMVQRDHEQKSQIVERQIRDDAAVEQAKRREQSMKEEKIKQERTRQEAEARQKAAAKLAAEAQKAAYEAAKKEAVEREAAKSRAEAVPTSSQISQNSVAHATVANNIEINSESPGIKVYADSSALKAELRRRALHDQVPSNIYLSKEYSRYDRQIGKSISKLMPTTDSVKARASELIKALDGQDCPRPIACRLFADKMISIVKSRNPKDKTFGNLAFACGYVMLLVTNQVPDAMDYLLAEFHKVCMYTVPKHLHALNAQARNTDYFRLIGYQEEDGKLQSTEAYLVNVVAYVKLYAAMIQTEIKGVRHPHGLAEGWKWLGMFLNTLPAITATAFALHAFLKMAGYALYKKYGSQFMKILDVISRQFIPALKEQGLKVQPEAINNLENYLKDKKHLEEPEGQYLAQQLLSKVYM